MNEQFLLNLSLVLAHTILFEHKDAPTGVADNFVNGFGFGIDTLSSIIAGKPSIPQFTPVNLGDEQSKAIAENTSALPKAEALASSTNTFNINQIQSMLRQVIPGYDAMVGGVSKNITDELSGKIPQDVSDAIQTSAAARSVGGGFGGSGMGRNLVARDLGLTSLDLTSKGISTAQSWLSTMDSITKPGMFSLSSMFVTPQQQAAVTESNNTGQFQRDYASNMNDWQHSLGVAGSQDLQDSMGTLTSLMGSSAGGKAGGGGSL